MDSFSSRKMSNECVVDTIETSFDDKGQVAVASNAAIATGLNDPLVSILLGGKKFTKKNFCSASLGTQRRVQMLKHQHQSTALLDGQEQQKSQQKQQKQEQQKQQQQQQQQHHHNENQNQKQQRRVDDSNILKDAPSRIGTGVEAENTINGVPTESPSIQYNSPHDSSSIGTVAGALPVDAAASTVVKSTKKRVFRKGSPDTVGCTKNSRDHDQTPLEDKNLSKQRSLALVDDENPVDVVPDTESFAVARGNNIKEGPSLPLLIEKMVQEDDTSEMKHGFHVENGIEEENLVLTSKVSCKNEGHQVPHRAGGTSGGLGGLTQVSHGDQVHICNLDGGSSQTVGHQQQKNNDNTDLDGKVQGESDTYYQSTRMTSHPWCDTLEVREVPLSAEKGSTFAPPVQSERNCSPIPIGPESLCRETQNLSDNGQDQSSWLLSQQQQSPPPLESSTERKNSLPSNDSKANSTIPATNISSDKMAMDSLGEKKDVSPVVEENPDDEHLVKEDFNGYQEEPDHSRQQQQKTGSAKDSAPSPISVPVHDVAPVEDMGRSAIHDYSKTTDDKACGLDIELKKIEPLNKLSKKQPERNLAKRRGCKSTSSKASSNPSSQENEKSNPGSNQPLEDSSSLKNSQPGKNASDLQESHDFHLFRDTNNIDSCDFKLPMGKETLKTHIQQKEAIARPFLRGVPDVKPDGNFDRVVANVSKLISVEENESGPEDSTPDSNGLLQDSFDLSSKVNSQNVVENANDAFEFSFILNDECVYFVLGYLEAGPARQLLARRMYQQSDIAKPDGSLYGFVKENEIFWPADDALSDVLSVQNASEIKIAVYLDSERQDADFGNQSFDFVLLNSYNPRSCKIAKLEPDIRELFEKCRNAHIMDVSTALSPALPTENQPNPVTDSRNIYNKLKEKVLNAPRLADQGSLQPDKNNNENLSKRAKNVRRDPTPVSDEIMPVLNTTLNGMMQTNGANKLDDPILGSIKKRARISPATSPMRKKTALPEASRGKQIALPGVGNHKQAASPEANKRIFDGYVFCFTLCPDMSAKIKNAGGKVVESEEDYYAQLENIGPPGSFFESTQDFQSQLVYDGREMVKPKVVLIVEKCCTTFKYLIALAMKAPIINLQWVKKCLQKNMVIDHRNYMMPSGEISTFANRGLDLKEKLSSYRQKDQMHFEIPPYNLRPMFGVEYIIGSQNTKFKEKISQFMRMSGAKGLDGIPIGRKMVKADHTFYITDEPPKAALKEQLQRLGIFVTSWTWIKESLILQSPIREDSKVFTHAFKKC